MTVARLGYEIDSSGAVKAAGDLDRMHTAAKRAERGAKTTAATAVKFSGAMKSSAAQTANLGAQLNDIGVMLAAGQNPLQLAVQQGTQINQVFAQMGGGKAALRGLAAGFMSMVNPMSLATIGIIAGGAALVQWAVSAAGAGEEAKSLEDSLDDLSGAIEDYRRASVNGAAAAEYIRDQFGRVTEQTIELGERMQALRIRQIMLDAADAANLLANSFSGGLRSELARLEGLLGPNWLDDESIAAKNLAAALDEIRTAGGPEQQLEAVRALGDQFVRVTGGIDAMNDEQRAFYSQVLQTESSLSNVVNITYDADGATNSWAASMAGVRVEIEAIGASLSAIGGGVLDNAAKAAEIQALRAGKNIKEAAQESVRLRKEAEFDARESGANFFERLLIEGERYQFERGLQLDAELDRERAAAREREKEASKGGGARPFELGVGDIERTIEGLRTQREIVDQWYLQSQEALRMASEAELAIIGGRQEAEERLEREHRERLAGIRSGYDGNALDQAETFLGDMASALQGGNDKMIAAAQAFASVEALINAYRAYNQVIADPSLPWFAKIPAAVGVLSAGLKTVQSIKSLGSSSSGAGSATSSGVTATSAPTAAPQRQDAVIQLEGALADVLAPLMDSIVSELQSQSEDGVNIVGVTAR